LTTLLRGCDLHLHILGAFHADDMLRLGKPCYREVDWSAYIAEYQNLYGTDPNPTGIFEQALSGTPGGFEALRGLHVYGPQDSGDFARWEAKMNFFVSIWSHYRDMGERGDRELLETMLSRHRSEGLDYVEYRLGSGMGGFMYWHALCARVLQEASVDGFTARYILSLPRYAPLEAYALARQLLQEHPELAQTIVGIDFASVEEGHPPKRLRPLFEAVQRDNLRYPESALSVVYHVGESFFDKSLESAVRWCHEVADMGVKRLGHALALGLDPRVAIARRAHAHECELVSERLDQIAYDLHHADALKSYGVALDLEKLSDEREKLMLLDPDSLIDRPYDDVRLAEVVKRQDYVLDRLLTLGTVIECCPTSNLRIGGVPDATHHPLHRFLAHGVNLAICTDDPGNFDVTLASEINWVLAHTGLAEPELEQRVGDPRRFALG
jgi:hypothetical protein